MMCFLKIGNRNESAARVPAVLSAGVGESLKSRLGVDLCPQDIFQTQLFPLVPFIHDTLNRFGGGEEVLLWLIAKW